MQRTESIQTSDYFRPARIEARAYSHTSQGHQIFMKNTALNMTEIPHLAPQLPSLVHQSLAPQFAIVRIRYALPPQILGASNNC